MNFFKKKTSKFYKKINLLQEIPCEKCNFCFKMRLMEMGFISDEEIEITDYKFGLWTINILSETGKKMSTLAVRNEEVNKCCVL
jgi:hypothetical protein